MADQDDREKPSLELPSFTLRRRKRSAPASVEAPAPEPTSAPTPEPATGGQPLFADEAPTMVSTGSNIEDRPRRRFPQLSGPTAAMVTGALVGVLAVGTIWLLLRLCELVSGTSSCGNPGFLLLLVAVVALGLVGATLLRALGVEAPGSTSALAVGLLTVVVLLFLVDALFSPWMILVVPAIAVAAYLLAHLVTTAAAADQA